MHKQLKNSVIVSYATVALLALADSAAARDKQIHYQVTPPADYPSAQVMLIEASREAQAAAQDRDTRRIHAISYKMEAALDVMQSQLDRLKTDVEQMHQASEKQDMDEAANRLEAIADQLEQIQTR